MTVRYRVPMRTAEDRWRPVGGFTAPELAVLTHLHHVEHPTAQHRHLLPAITSGAPVSPIVNHGVWLIVCPSCPSAVRASRRDRRFLCCECGSVATGGTWLPVAWPADADRIEQLLAARPDKANRNWAPPETVATLELENAARGIR